MIRPILFSISPLLCFVALSCILSNATVAAEFQSQNPTTPSNDTISDETISNETISNETITDQAPSNQANGEFNKSETQKALPANKPRIAIVIDDLGYRKSMGSALVALKHPITFAVIPDTPYARDLIELARGADHEVILHVPMETLEQIDWEQGLTTEMARDEFTEALNIMLEHYPYAAGINNHGGSKLTTDNMRMTWVMETLRTQNRYFLDSKTTSESVAAATAKKLDVPHASRDVFLDNEQDENAITAQFEELKRIASIKGYAIAIGHPYPETLKVLQEQLILLEQSGFELTYASELLDFSQRQALTQLINN